MSGQIVDARLAENVKALRERARRRSRLRLS